MFRVLSLLIAISFLAELSFAGWTPWVTLGGEINADPATCTARGTTYVVARGLDNKMWYRRRTLSTGVWDTWKRVNAGPQTFSGSPSVACRIYSTGQNYFIVDAVGSDGFHYQTYQAHYPDSFTPWTKMSFITGIPENKMALGSGLSTPSLADNVTRVQYFSKGRNNALYHSYCEPDGCIKRWNLIYAQVFSDPAATFQSSGRLDLVVQATTGTLIHGFFEGGIWFPFKYMGSGTVYSSPDLVSRGQGSLDLFVRGANNKLQHKRWSNGVWGGWSDLGSPMGQGIFSGPGATTYASRARIFVFARGYDNALWYRAWAP